MENLLLRLSCYTRCHYQLNHFRQHGSHHLEFELKELRIPRVNRFGKHGHEKHGYAKGTSAGCSQLLVVHLVVLERSVRVRILLWVLVTNFEE